MAVQSRAYKSYTDEWFSSIGENRPELEALLRTSKACTACALLRDGGYCRYPIDYNRPLVDFRIVPNPDLPVNTVRLCPLAYWYYHGYVWVPFDRAVPLPPQFRTWPACTVPHSPNTPEWLDALASHYSYGLFGGPGTLQHVRRSICLRLENTRSLHCCPPRWRKPWPRGYSSLIVAWKVCGGPDE
jgi:hypothetical protein